MGVGAARSCLSHPLDDLCPPGGVGWRGYAFRPSAGGAYPQQPASLDHGVFHRRNLGIGYGLLAGRLRGVEKATAGIPQLLLLVPGLAWIPVAILLFGIGETATVFMIAIAAVAPVAINVLSGIKTVDIQLVRAARMMGARRHILFFHVLIPAALPSLISGLRIGLGTGWRVLVAAEMVVGTGSGLGYAIIQARWTLDYPASFACIAVICAIGLLVERGLLGPLERRTRSRWILEEGPR